MSTTRITDSDAAGKPGATPTTLPIAAVGRGDDGAAHKVLADVAKVLTDEGWALAGAVQADTEEGPEHACSMALSILPHGPSVELGQNLGAEATGCRLNHVALEDAVGLVENSLQPDTRLLILNKFGQRESEGAGFRQAIGNAIVRGIPVLIGVSPAHQGALEAFAGDSVRILPSRAEDVLAWCREVSR